MHDDENNNGDGVTINRAIKEYGVTHDKICDLKLGGIYEKIENTENRIKFAIYLSTSLVGIVLVLVQYYLMCILKVS